MDLTKHIHDRYTLAMFPALFMGLLTNIYIISVLIFLNAYSALFSPIIGSIIFLGCFILLRSKKITAKQTFLIVAYIVVIEIYIHIYFLGWNSGFYYYMFLLPIVFLLNSTWKIWMIFFFNGSIILMVGLLLFLYHDKVGYYLISEEAETNLNLLNLAGTGVVVFFIMINFSRTIHKKDEALIVANSELEQRNKEISKQHKHLQILVKEIHHRVKNNLQIISSLMSLQRRSVEDQEVVAVLNESRRRIEAIALIHQKLYQNKNVDQVDFKSYLVEIMDSTQIMSPHVKCNVHSEDATLNLDIAVPLGLIISELITNSIKHAFKGIKSPELNVTLQKNQDDFKLIVHDNGIGLSDDFNFESPTSLGIEIIEALIEQIDGRIEYHNNNGAQFDVFFQGKPISVENN